MWVQIYFFACPRLARNYFAVEASSATSERLFSQADLVVASIRNRISGDTAADIIFLHHQHQSMKHNNFRLCQAVRGSFAVQRVVGGVSSFCKRMSLVR